MPSFDLFADFASWFIKALIAAAISICAWLFKKNKDKIDIHEKEIATLKAQAVSEDKVREIVTESINNAVDPICEHIREIKELVKSNTEIVKQLELKMAKEEGRQELLKELKAVGNGV